MHGTVVPAARRSRAAVIAQADDLAHLVSEGVPLHVAGEQMLGMTKGQTCNTWREIKRGLGEQAI